MQRKETINIYCESHMTRYRKQSFLILLQAVQMFATGLWKLNWMLAYYKNTTSITLRETLGSIILRFNNSSTKSCTVLISSIYLAPAQHISNSLAPKDTQLLRRCKAKKA